MVRKGTAEELSSRAFRRALGEPKRPTTRSSAAVTCLSPWALRINAGAYPTISDARTGLYRRADCTAVVALTTAHPPMLRLHRTRSNLMYPPCLALKNERTVAGKIPLIFRRVDISRCLSHHRGVWNGRSEHKRSCAHAMGAQEQGGHAHFCTPTHTEEHLAGRYASLASRARRDSTRHCTRRVP